MTVPEHAPAELAAFSTRLGNNPDLVQGAGGNTSAKVGNTLWVKASGKWLSVANDEDIFVGLDLALVRERITQGRGDDLAGTVTGGPQGLRPSIETTLHALLPHPVVAHVHSVRTIATAVRKDAVAELGARLSGLRWALVPYHRPGLPLTQGVAAELADKHVDVVVLGNHGLVIGGPDCANVEALLKDVETRLDSPRRAGFTPDTEALQRLAGTAYRLPQHPQSHGMAGAPAITGGGSLYPDHVVFLGPSVGVSADTAPAPLREGLPPPGIWLVPGKGVLVRADINRNGEEMVRALALVVAHIADGADLNYLSAEDENELLGWEAEKYRQALAR